MRVAAFVVTVALVLSACAPLAKPTPGITKPVRATASLAAGLTATDALRLAREHVGPTMVFHEAVAGRYADVYVGFSHLDQLPPDRLVWAVGFDDALQLCPPDGSPCFMRRGTSTVLLDYVTGEFLTTSTVAPAS